MDILTERGRKTEDYVKEGRKMFLRMSFYSVKECFNCSTRLNMPCTYFH